MLSHKTTTDPKTVFVAPYHPDTEIFRYTNARYRDNIRKVDEEIGEVIDQLREDGLLEDTFIFYFGDHGGVLPRSKGYAYDSGLHVPLVVRVPSKWQHLVAVPRGSSVSGFVSFVDFGPTLLHLAGLTVPEECDGSPFLGRGISQSDLAERDLAVGYADRFDEKYDLVRTVRKGKFEYVRSYQPFLFDGLQNNYRYKMLAYREWRELFREGKLNEIQSQFFRSRPAELLFDLEADPHETRNLADDPQFAAVLNDLRTTNQNWVKSMPDLSFFPESVLVESAADDPVSFGAKQKERIGRLVDIADLNLVPFETAAVAIDRALQSQDPWERYWGLIVCSSHGDDAKRFAERARQLAKSDPERLVRTRAAEFLAIIRADDPQPTILDVLRKTDSGVEAALVLNTLTFLRDGAGYPFDGLSAELFQPAVLKNDSVQRRLEYLLK